MLTGNLAMVAGNTRVARMKLKQIRSVIGEDAETAGRRKTAAPAAEDEAQVPGTAARMLEIAERLIASAPGMSPGKVIPYLWHLKAEGLAAMGQPEEAGFLLQAAVGNAQVPGARFLLWRLHASLAYVHDTMGEATEAEAHSSTARLLVDALADTIRVQDLREGFLRGANGLLRSPP